MRAGRWLIAGAGLLAAAAYAQPPSASNTVPLDKHKLSYAIGYQIGSQFADGNPAVDIPTMERAIEDAYQNRKPAVSVQDMREQLQSLDERMRARAMAEFERVAAQNLRRSMAFMEHNRSLPGVIQLPSGVQYSVIKRGDPSVSNSQPTINSVVVLNYRGSLIDGTEFDSTWAHGAPVSYPVSRMIYGWRDVIPRMHVGDRWKVVIPPQLAYGERGEPPRIGPNEALVFDIELLRIEQP